jgi:kynurenine formamidase
MSNLRYWHSSLCGIVGSVVVAGASITLGTTALAAQERAPVSAETVELWMSELSNAGRWGPEDERGTLNLITPETTLAGARLVRDGHSVSLSHDYLKEAAEDATSPFGHEILGAGGRGSFVTDRFDVVFHGYAHSHIDALCHMSHEGVAYNGFERSGITAEIGCPALAITTMKQGIATRGVLMDIARLKGVEYLEPGTAIYPEDLEAWEAATGIRVGPGDALLVRSGRWARREETGPWATGRLAAGLHASVAPWLRERGVAILGSDYTNDVLPSGVEGVSMPIHQLTLVAMGMPLFDNLDLEAVAAAAAERNRWEFFLVAAPLAVPGGTGSPLNPLAIF